VGERTSVPVPPTLWLEEDPVWLGAPFLVMGRVDGEVPPDMPPYTFPGNWFFDATAEQRSTAQRAAAGVLAGLHSIGADDPAVAFLALDVEGESHLRRHVNDQKAFYEWVCSDGMRSPLIERAFGWIEANWPADTGDDVLSWGDSRVGNMLFRDFEPVAVLDWEMAALGPRGLDLGWMAYLHRFFHDIAEQLELPGLPDTLRYQDLAAVYAELTGVSVGDMEFFMTYAALRHAVIMFRITRRMVQFGEAEMPDNPDHAFIHHPTLLAMLDGTYWGRL
jgi:aminoglycoside phosphotransferase (APT) family kinase protein